ncbi:MAG TPA: gamma-glutamyl-gamma-aminobutyrate hydrolase family protein [Roseomonas sp.]|jgi:putative glutamine amidotransferase
MTARPLIGLTLDAEEPGGYSKLPWYALRRNYFAAIAQAGGLPVALPHDPALAEDYLDRLDGLLVTGGAFDVDPSLYGGGPRHETVVLKEGRTAFEIAVLRGALRRDIPVLGICGGEQLLAVALGGTLIQHIPDSVPDALAHEQPNPRTEPGHEVALTPGTLLSRIVGAPAMAVNSAHHQAVDRPGEGAIVNARAPDGVVEGLEHPGYRFCLGVQWHPEYAVDARDQAILDAFVEAARHTGQNRAAA